MRPLERDHVGRILDDADQRAVPARIGADLAQLLLGQVEAARARPDPLLDLPDRVGQGVRVGL
jgi:hypothetical protein